MKWERMAQGPAVTVEFFFAKEQLTHVHLDVNVSETGMLWRYCTDEKAQPTVLKGIKDFLEAYCLKQQKRSSIELNLSGLPPFTQRALQAIEDLPFGEATDYSGVAARCGSPKAYRAAGSACGRNPFPLLIPCHRVLAAQGKLGGFSIGGLDVKRRLLDFEGISYSP